MPRKFEYAIAKLADPVRGESLNAAIIIFHGDTIDVRLPRRLEKLRALSQALDLDVFRRRLERLVDLDHHAVSLGLSDVKSRLAALTELASIQFSECAWFDAPSHDSYESTVGQILTRLVEPEPARLKRIQKRTRLISHVRKAFRNERVLARKGEGLESHRIVANYEIAEGLEADFILRNGAMHVFETVDASDEGASARRIVGDIAVSALVFEQARMTFGENATASRLIYDASSSFEKLATPSLEAAAHQGAKLVNWASLDDRRQLLVELSSLAEPTESAGKSRSPHFVATAQSKLAFH